MFLLLISCFVRFSHIFSHIPRQQIESFGGKVTGSVSGRTDVLVVGKSPGFSKVSKARKNRKRETKLLDLKDLKEMLEGGTQIEDAPAKKMVIKEFSAGYMGNGLARLADDRNYAIASGTAPAAEAKGATSGAPKRKRKTEVKKKPSSSKQKKKPNLQLADGIVVTCDICGVECTQKSWFVEALKKDFCANCIKECSMQGKLQSGGCDV